MNPPRQITAEELNVFPHIQAAATVVECSHFGKPPVDNGGPAGTVHRAGAQINFRVEGGVGGAGSMPVSLVVVRMQVEHDNEPVLSDKLLQQQLQVGVEPIVGA